MANGSGYPARPFNGFGGSERRNALSTALCGAIFSAQKNAILGESFVSTTRMQRSDNASMRTPAVQNREASMQRRGIIRKSCPPGSKCFRTRASICPRLRGDGTQFNTIERTTASYELSGSIEKKSICSIRGCCELISIALTSSHGTERNCVLTAPTSSSLSAG